MADRETQPPRIGPPSVARGSRCGAGECWGGRFRYPARPRRWRTGRRYSPFFLCDERKRTRMGACSMRNILRRAFST